MNIRRFMHRSRKDEDLAEEIESHLAHEQDQNAARGLPPQEARRQARLRFGNPSRNAGAGMALSFLSVAGRFVARSPIRFARARKEPRDLPSSPFL